MRKLALAAAGTLSLLATSTTAQAAEDQAEASATGKGIVGGALLGGEAVMLVEAAFEVKPAWAYIVGGLAGGVAGGVGGYFAEQNGSAKLSMYLLTGGMALVIPTTVAVLSASAYDPPADYTQDQGPAEAPAANPPGAETGAPPMEEGKAASPRRQARLKRRMRLPTARLHLPVAPPALVGVGSEGSLSLSVPAVEVRDAYTRKELFQYGVSQKTEVRVPVFNFTF